MRLDNVRNGVFRVAFQAWPGGVDYNNAKFGLAFSGELPPSKCASSSPPVKSGWLNLTGTKCTKQRLRGRGGLHGWQSENRLTDFLDCVQGSNLLRREYGVLPASKMYFSR
jgi:hypothetical protein